MWIFDVSTVLSDQKKRMMYDAGMYDPEEDEDEVCFFLFFCFHLNGV